MSEKYFSEKKWTNVSKSFQQLSAVSVASVTTNVNVLVNISIAVYFNSTLSTLKQCHYLWVKSPRCRLSDVAAGGETGKTLKQRIVGLVYS